ncbi:hypothetical protein ABIE53_006210 [Burkholderia sp. OAS925]
MIVPCARKDTARKADLCSSVAKSKGVDHGSILKFGNGPPNVQKALVHVVRDVPVLSGRQGGYHVEATCPLAERSEPQCLHFMASALMSSAQKGHFFSSRAVAPAAAACAEAFREKAVATGLFAAMSARTLPPSTFVQEDGTSGAKGVAAPSTPVWAQTRAPTHPSTVQPSRRFRTKMATRFGCFRCAAANAGEK